MTKPYIESVTVLILVVVEDVLVRDKVEPIGLANAVLILVVVEDVLVPVLTTSVGDMFLSMALVLILVVVEDVLVLMTKPYIESVASGS